MIKWFLGLRTEERKNLALLMMFGGAVIFTLYAGIALWLLAGVPQSVLWLGLVAHVQILTIMTGFIALLVRRRISVGKEGVTIDDEEKE